MKRIDESWLNFTETMQKRVPGYAIGTDHLINNVSDVTVNLDELMSLLRSKDIAKY